MQETIDTYVNFIKFLKESPVIWTALFDQYEHHRNLVGRAISHAAVADINAPLGQLVTDTVKQAQLIDALDQMEEKRLLLCVLVNYVEGDLNSQLRDRVNALPSKMQILALRGTVLSRDREAYYASIAEKNLKGLTLALRAGVDLNRVYPADSVAPPPPPVPTLSIFDHLLLCWQQIVETVNSIPFILL